MQHRTCGVQYTTCSQSALQRSPRTHTPARIGAGHHERAPAQRGPRRARVAVRSVCTRAAPGSGASRAGLSCVAVWPHRFPESHKYGVCSIVLTRCGGVCWLVASRDVGSQQAACVATFPRVVALLHAASLQVAIDAAPAAGPPAGGRWRNGRYGIPTVPLGGAGSSPGSDVCVCARARVCVCVCVRVGRPVTHTKKSKRHFLLLCG